MCALELPPIPPPVPDPKRSVQVKIASVPPNGIRTRKWYRQRIAFLERELVIVRRELEILKAKYTG